MLILKTADAARDPNHVPNLEKSDTRRQLPEISAYGYGQHNCLGDTISIAFIAGLVKQVADLKNLRPAPGDMGKVKSINVGFDKIYLNDSWFYFGFYVSTWKVQFDGHGKGAYHGDNKPRDALTMQQYYYWLQKRKAEQGR